MAVNNQTQVTWKIPQVENHLVEKLCKETNLSKIICTILYNRGYQTRDEIERFLACDYSQDFSSINDIKKGAKVVISAIKNNVPIIIHGDYDVDGISSTSILFDFIFHKLDYKNIIPFIPSRGEQGYGLSEKSLTSILEIVTSKNDLKTIRLQNLKPLIISVDCGIKDIELIDEKWGLIFDFIITDHHTIRQDSQGNNIFSKKAKAIIHPAHPKSKIKFKEICGALVTYKFVEAINFTGKFQKETNEYIPLVCLATNCDVMPIVDENRLIISKGLEKFSSLSGGLRSLVDICGLNEKPITTYDLGFVIGPRINASGRIGNPLDAVRLLVTRDENLAKKISVDLNRLNVIRQEITKDRIIEAERQLESQLENGHQILIVIGHEWEEGIVGLIAGKICEKYNLPTIVFSVVGGKAVGSARSKEGFDITNAISNSSGFLEKFGGHKGAAGLTAKLENLEGFCKQITDLVSLNNSSELFRKVFQVESKIGIGEVDQTLLNEIEKLKPFGHGFEEPNFLIEECFVHRVFEMGSTKQHLKYIIGEENFNEGIELIVFNAVDKYKHINSGDSIMAIVNLQNNVWNGINRIQMIGKHLVKV